MKCRTIFSLIVSIVFIGMSLACLSSGDETTDDCDFLPTPVNKSQTLVIKAYNKLTKLPILNASFYINAEYHIKRPRGVNCIFSTDRVDYYQTATAGIAQQVMPYTFESDDDYVILKINPYVPQYSLELSGTMMKYNESSKTMEIYLLPFDDNP